MDYIDGIPLTRGKDIKSNPSYDLEKSIKTYVNAAIRNWFKRDRETYLFQADPHLSNILALPNGDAANIDYGLTAELSRKEAEQARELIIAVYLQDIKRVLKVATNMTGVSYESYAPVLRPEIEVYLEKTKNEGFGFWFLEFARIMVRNKIKFPLHLTTFGRTNLVLDGLVNTYMPGKTTLDLVGEELERAAIQEMLGNLAGLDWLRLGYSISERIKIAPSIIADIITDPLSVVLEISKAVKATASPN